jgi:hypothetical protein
MSEFSFFNMARIGADEIDNTQRNLANTRFSGYMLSNYFAEPSVGTHVDFATQLPTVAFSNRSGAGLSGYVVDVDSQLTIKRENARSLEKLSLHQRPFLTVPYLGRGSCDPTLEAQIMQGENSRDKKSVSTIMTKNFMEHTMFPMDDKMNERLGDGTIQEAALDGWVRGGMLTREMGKDGAFVKQTRPNHSF